MTVVTWHQAEQALLEAFEGVSALPDRERAFLRAGSRSCWPQVVRDRVTDYADTEAVPSARLTRRMMARIDAMFLADPCFAQAMPAEHAGLVATVVTLKLWGEGRFEWSEVYRRMGGRLFSFRVGEVKPSTSDAMRKAYERAIGKLAVAMGEAGCGAGDA